MRLTIDVEAVRRALDLLATSHRDGDHDALPRALGLCARAELPMPGWLARAVAEGCKAWERGDGGAFLGVSRPKHFDPRKAAIRSRYRRMAYEYIDNQLRHGCALTRGRTGLPLWDEVAELINGDLAIYRARGDDAGWAAADVVKGGAVKDWYYQMAAQIKACGDDPARLAAQFGVLPLVEDIGPLDVTR